MDRISLCVRVVAERVPVMKNIFTVECRNSLSSMLDADKRVEEEKLTKVFHLVICLTVVRKLYGLSWVKEFVIFFSMVRNYLAKLFMYYMLLITFYEELQDDICFLFLLSSTCKNFFCVLLSKGKQTGTRRSEEEG